MVEKDNKNKGLFLGLAAATALVGAALMWQYVFNADDDEDEAATGGIQAELETAGLFEVKKQNGMLDPQYMVKLLNFVTCLSRKRRETERSAALETRREAMKVKNWDEYRGIVKEQFMAEDQMCQAVLREALEVLTETTEQEFQMTMA